VEMTPLVVLVEVLVEVLEEGLVSTNCFLLGGLVLALMAEMMTETNVAERMLVCQMDHW
jgi:hypothetical protein